MVMSNLIPKSVFWLLYFMSTVFGLKLIYNQIKRLFTGIKFLFIQIRYVLASRQQVELCDELQARDFILILMTILMSIISLKCSFHKHKRTGEIRILIIKKEPLTCFTG
jgi:hypothetical protein